jgi:hypothetical protein
VRLSLRVGDSSRDRWEQLIRISRYCG